MTYATTYTHDTGRVDVIARAPTRRQCERRAKVTHWHVWGDTDTVEYTHDCECGGVVKLDEQCVACRCYHRTHPIDRAAWTPIRDYCDAAYLRESADAVRLVASEAPRRTRREREQHVRMLAYVRVVLDMADEMESETTEAA